MVKLFRWILSFLPSVMDFATKIFDMMTSPIIEVIDKSDLPTWITSLLSPLLSIFGDASIIGFMCGTGLTLFVIAGIVKYFVTD